MGNGMKLKLIGYVLFRCDTNEYLSELVVRNNLAIAGWTTSKYKADISKFKFDAMIVGGNLADSLNTQMKLFQLFKFQDGCIVNYVAKCFPEKLLT